MEVILVSTRPSGNDESSQRERLREDLRRRFPAEAGYEVSEATWIDIVDGKPELMTVTNVTGNGIDFTFFPRAPKNRPGARNKPTNDAGGDDRHRRTTR
jgi:hypothetical protein